MTDVNWLEDRVEALISAYADRAPTEVDALGVTSLAATGAAPGRFGVAAGTAARLHLVAAVLSIGLLVTIVGGALLGVGRPPNGDPEESIERRPVAPFIGLPPIGAPPSLPETGELVLYARGRCTSIGEFCWVWIFADGRLIWIRDGASPFGANEHTTGLIEQRLAPSGVARLTSVFSATGACSGLDRRGPIVCAPGIPGPAPFPKIAVRGWIDPSWGLLPSEWEDPSISAFVPSRMGACFFESDVISASSFTSWQQVESSRVLEWLPSEAADLLRGRDIEFPPLQFSPLERGPGLAMTCFSLTTEEARTLSDILSRAGLDRDELMAAYALGYHLEPPRPFQDGVIWIAPVLPDGEWFVSGGG
jgi:hypothetical protein